MNKPILRVADLNNFNFSCKELNQLKEYKNKYRIFVNSNSFVNLTDDYKSIVTINPYLNKFIEPKGAINNIKACRIKYCFHANYETKKAFFQSVLWCRKNKIQMLITFQRFTSKKDLFNHTTIKTDKEIKTSNYKWIKNYYRPIEKRTFNFKFVNYCDLKGQGCPSCNNCTKLTYNVIEPIQSINLSTSGKCKFSCPSCFAKKITYGKDPSFDKVKQNRKQKGNV